MKETINIWLAILMLALCVLTIAGSENIIGEVLFNHANYLIFAYLFFSMFFLFIKRTKLMLTAIICCALLTVYFKNRSKTEFQYDKTTGNLNISVVNVVASDNHPDVKEAINSILAFPSSLVAIQEASPDYHKVALRMLSPILPYHTEVINELDLTRTIIFSKYRIKKVSNFEYNHKKTIQIVIEIGKKSIEIINTQIYPDFFYQPPYNQLQHIEKVISQYNSSAPKILFGEFNSVQWSRNILRLKNELQLKDSRMNSFLDSPTDHILYSKHLKCTKFVTLSNAYSPHVGVLSSFELNY